MQYKYPTIQAHSLFVNFQEALLTQAHLHLETAVLLLSTNARGTLTTNRAEQQTIMKADLRLLSALHALYYSLGDEAFAQSFKDKFDERVKKLAELTAKTGTSHSEDATAPAAPLDTWTTHFHDALQRLPVVFWLEF
jgi:hypothetical protein